MKKGKILLLVVLVSVLIGCLGAFFIESEDAQNSKRVSETVTVTNSEAIPGMTATTFEILRSDSYQTRLEWKNEEGFLTGAVIKNEENEVLFAGTGESVDIDSIPTLYEAGTYTLEFHYLASEAAWNTFMETYELEVLGDDEYTFAEEGTWKVNYKLSWREAGKYQKEGQYGFFAGGLVAIILLTFLVLFLRKDENKKNYDERQILVRGRAYQYGFFTMMLCNAVFVMFSLMGVRFFERAESGLIISIFIAVIVFASYSIWKDAYFALNEKRISFLTIFSVLGVVNTILGIINFVEGYAIVDGRLRWGACNLGVGIMLLSIVVQMFAKQLKEKKEEQ